MYSIISACGTPIILLNAARNYFAWQRGEEDKVQRFERLNKWNIGVTVSLAATGFTAVYLHATKFQKPTPLIMSAMAYRIVTIALISLAAGRVGNVVNHWCYMQQGK